MSCRDLQLFRILAALACVVVYAPTSLASARKCQNRDGVLVFSEQLGVGFVKNRRGGFR